jgi:hypothetical protein
MDQDSVKLGLLMETAQTHQKLAEAAIEKLSEHTQALEAVARDQIQRALVDALQTVHAEVQGAIEALQKIMRALRCGRLVLLRYRRASRSLSPGGRCRRRLKSPGYAPNGMSSRATLRSSSNAAHGQTCVAAGRGTCACG